LSDFYEQAILSKSKAAFLFLSSKTIINQKQCKEEQNALEQPDHDQKLIAQTRKLRLKYVGTGSGN
jgi:hypothetical protein